jgi:hypothetical protein
MLGFLFALFFGGKSKPRRRSRVVRSARAGWKVGRALGGRR